MRLSSDHIKIIKKATQEIYGDARVWLFDSRVDDNKKGGDIDLLDFFQNPLLQKYARHFVFCDAVDLDIHEAAKNKITKQIEAKGRALKEVYLLKPKQKLHFMKK
jgi:hypothetical protein